jgi:phosphoribosylformylglycinamidine synthase
MDVDIARVARREPGMNATEVMTSESQERMLAIVRPDDLAEVLGLCERWEIRASVVGQVNDTGRFRVYDGRFDAVGVPGANPSPPPGEEPRPLSSDAPPRADVPVDSLGDGPRYERPLQRPADQDDVEWDDPAPELAQRFPAGADLSGELLALLDSPTIADKSWVWRQYDHQLFLNTVVGPGADAAVLRLKGTARALALTTDGKARFCRLEPFVGAQLAVLEAVRNLACVGADPKAMVNCLNFGNPEHETVMWQFSEVVDGLSEVCRALGVPVVGGNVSFYNESQGRDIDPTPVIGVLGIVDALDAPPPPPALVAGRRVVVLGGTTAELGGSEWAGLHGLLRGTPPRADLEPAVALHDLVRALVRERVVDGVHDCADGGLAVALAEMAIRGEVGFRVAPETGGLAPALLWFSESASRVVLAVAPERVDALLERAGAAGVVAADIGEATGDRLVAEGDFDVSLADATRAWRDAIPSRLGVNAPTR